MGDIKERLAELLAYFEECGWTSRAHTVQEAFDEIDRHRARLNELENQEPVAWRYKEPDVQYWNFTDWPGRASVFRQRGKQVEPLYQRPPAAVPEGWRESVSKAIDRAKVFDDGGDGADSESARSVVAILTPLLQSAELTSCSESEIKADYADELAKHFREQSLKTRNMWNGMCHTYSELDRFFRRQAARLRGKGEES